MVIKVNAQKGHCTHNGEVKTSVMVMVVVGGWDDLECESPFHV